MANQYTRVPTISAAIVGPVTAVVVDGLKPITNPTILNTSTAPFPNVETSFTLLQIKQFDIINRGTDVVKLKFAAGGDYITLSPKDSYREEDIQTQDITFYVESASASQRLEVIYWH